MMQWGMGRREVAVSAASFPQQQLAVGLLLLCALNPIHIAIGRACAAGTAETRKHKMFTKVHPDSSGPLRVRLVLLPVH